MTLIASYDTIKPTRYENGGIMKKVCLCLAFVLTIVCILCSCSDLPAPSTSETVNPSVDVTLKKWEDCGVSIEKAEKISGIEFCIDDASGHLLFLFAVLLCGIQ